MAITKNHPINSTLKSAIAYICNPEKTDSTLLIDSYACTPETADIEFAWTHKKTNENVKHLARHFIQSFEPGETTPEEAHEIGKQLAEEMLGGKYEFVLSTHTDRDHIHNHIIFNDVSFVDYKHIHINAKWYYETRKISDRICDEHGLSVIPPNENKGKEYYEYRAAKQGISYKTQLKEDINRAIRKSVDYNDFLLRMEIAGYEIKQGKYISFRAKDRERFVRGKTLGGYYTEESIKERISKNRVHTSKTEKCINLIIDIQNCIKAQESKGYEHWAKINNLKQAAKTLNFLTEHNLTTYEELKNATKLKQTDFDTVSDKIKKIERQINSTSILIKNIETYSRLKPIMQKRKTAKDKDWFDNKHRSKIILFKAALKELKSAKFPPIKELRTEYKSLTEQKEKLYEEYKKAKAEAHEIDIVKSNVDSLLGASHKPSRDISAHLEQ